MSSTVKKRTYTAHVWKYCILANKRLPNKKIEILLPKFRGCALNLRMGAEKLEVFRSNTVLLVADLLSDLTLL